MIFTEEPATPLTVVESAFTDEVLLTVLISDAEAAVPLIVEIKVFVPLLTRVFVTARALGATFTKSVPLYWRIFPVASAVRLTLVPRIFSTVVDERVPVTSPAMANPDTGVVPAVVSLPCASTVKVGIVVALPYEAAVTPVLVRAKLFTVRAIPVEAVRVSEITPVVALYEIPVVPESAARARASV
jgi:cytochrome c biogenesis protein CcdA